MAAVVNQAQRFAIPCIFGKQRALDQDAQRLPVATTGMPCIIQLRQLASSLSPLAVPQGAGTTR
jgi:hypothetical protein